MTVTKNTWDEEFIASEANGTRSRSVVTLAAGSDYAPGSVLIEELSESVAESGDFDTKTGNAVLVDDTLVTAYTAGSSLGVLFAGVLCRATDATEAAANAAVIDADAELKASRLVYGGTADADDIDFAAAGVKLV